MTTALVPVNLPALHEDDADAPLLRIGYLADRFCVSEESIRNWERQGLIPESYRTPGGHRRYTYRHVEAIERLLRNSLTVQARFG